MRWYNVATEEYMNENAVLNFIEDVLKDTCIDDYVDDEINDFYLPYKCGDVEISGSRIFKELEPYLYDQMRDEYLENLLQQCIDELGLYEPTEGMTLYLFLSNVIPWEADELRAVEARI